MKNIFILLLFLSTSVFAEVYMVKQPDGSISYSDKPSQHAEEVPPEELVAVPPVVHVPEIKRKINISVPTKQRANGESGYTKFALVSPKNEQTFQNQPSISLAVSVEPELMQGDMVQAYVDGAKRGKAVPSTSVNLGRLERGSHQVSAALIDSNGGEIARTSVVTIYIHHASVALRHTTPATKLTQPNALQKLTAAVLGG